MIDEKLTQELKVRLLADKARLEKELRKINNEILMVSQTEMSGENALEDDEADAATTTFERERDDSLGWNIRDMLNKINDALAKVEEGSYGICEECKQEINPERLKAIPYADKCLSCKSHEKVA